MELSIIIVNWNLKDHLRVCLDSILSGEDQVEKEVIVVDNASTDGSVHFIEKKYPEVKVIALGSNEGFSSANNRGYRQSKGRFILFLNPDTRIPGDSLKKLVRYMERCPSIGVVGPELIGDRDQVEMSWGEDPDILSELFQSLKLRLKRSRTIGPQSSGEECRERDVDWLTAACMLTRREVFEAVGMFDERYTMYFEDCDLCRRIREFGYRIVFYPVVQAYHYRGMARALDLERVEWEKRKGELLYYHKFNGGGQSLILRVYLLIKYILRIIILGLNRKEDEKISRGLHYAKEVCRLALRDRML